MAKRAYRTASGKMVDMDTLALKNETVIAVGNMNVNARGDKLGKGGNIVKSREELIADHYRVKSNTIPSEKPLPSAKNDSKKIIDDDPIGPMDAPAEPDPEPLEVLTDENTIHIDNNQELSTAEFNTTSDEWVEDSDGNFVKAEDLTTHQETTKPSTKGLADALASTKSISVPFEESAKQKARKARGVKRI